MSLIPSDILSSTQVPFPGSPAVTVQCSSSSSSSSSSSPSQKLQRPDKLEVFLDQKHAKRNVYNFVAWHELAPDFGHHNCFCFRCVASFSGETVHEGRRIVALLTPVTARWLTAPITQSLSAWTTSRAGAPGRSASTFTRLHTCRPKSNPVNNKSVRQQWQPRPQLQPW